MVGILCRITRCLLRPDKMGFAASSHENAKLKSRGSGISLKEAACSTLNRREMGPEVLRSAFIVSEVVGTKRLQAH